MRFFKINQNTATPIAAQIQPREKELQTLFENNLQTLLGVRFLGTEYPTSEGKRIDTIGIDGQNRPVIIEYKRASDKFLVSQTSEYGDWLMESKTEFAILVTHKIDPATANQINWSKMRLICIASEFSKTDERAARLSNKQIELIRYGILDDDILLLEQLAGDSGLDKLPLSSVTTDTRGVRANEVPSRQEYISSTYNTNTFLEHLEKAHPEVKARVNSLTQFLKSLGDNVAAKETKYYFAFIRRKNFASVQILSRPGKILIYVKINISSINLEDGFTRDVHNIGHLGPGNLEITINNDDDLEKAKPLLERSYQNSG